MGASNDRSPDRLTFYGRRHGRRLRPQPAENLQKGMEAFGIDPDAVAAAETLALPQLFAGHQGPFFLEIGFGGGEHLAARAAEKPGAAFIGAEPFINGVASLCGHIRHNDLSNIRIWAEDVRLLLPKLASASLDGAFILFPDPWPKYRHRDRRIIQPAMITELARLIRPGGELLLASDEPTAKSWMLQQMIRSTEFEWQASRPIDWQQPPAGWPGTRYMAKAEREGRRSSWFPFRRQS